MNSTTPTFRVEMKATGGAYTPAAWPTKHLGRPSDSTLAAYVESFEASTREGGVNAHLGAVTVWSAKVIRQSNSQVVASYTGPAFVAA
jgi:hypothetical protein